MWFDKCLLLTFFYDEFPVHALMCFWSCVRWLCKKKVQLNMNWGRKLKKASFIVSRTETFHNTWILVTNFPEKTTSTSLVQRACHFLWHTRKSNYESSGLSVNPCWLCAAGCAVNALELSVCYLHFFSIFLRRVFGDKESLHQGLAYVIQQKYSTF